MPEQSPNNFSTITPDNNSDNSSNPATPGVAAGSQLGSQPDNSSNSQESANQPNSSQPSEDQPSNQESQPSIPESTPDNSQPLVSQPDSQSSNPNALESSKPSSSESANQEFSPEPLKPSPRPKGMTPYEVANLTHIPGVSRFKSRKAKEDEVVADDLLNQQAPEKKPESLNQPLSTTDLEPTLLQEIITTNQEVFNSLGIKESPDNTGNLIDLEHELVQGNILLPTQEEHETRINAGYTVPIIIPGHITRKSIIAIFQDPQTYLNLNKQQTNTDNPIFIYDQAQKDLPNTSSQINKTRPQQLYLTYFKPGQEISSAHPATEAKSAEECLNILEQERQSNPELNLHGLTLEEYLTLQAYIKQTTNQYLDQKTRCWLPEDTVPDPDSQATQPVRCLSSDWDSGNRKLTVNSGSFGPSDPVYGSRFQAMPKYQETS